MKLLSFLFTAFCIATVIAEVFGAGLLWYRGQLTPQAVQEMHSVLVGGDVDENEGGDDKDLPQASLDEVIQARARLAAEFDAKAAELRVFKEMITQDSQDLTQRQAKFEKQKKAFDEQLQLLQDQMKSQATEQSRGIVLALAPKDAAEQLMKLELAEAIVLMKGMPEKSIAKILKEFRTGEEQVARGNLIFQALTKGEPQRSLLDAEKASLNATPSSEATDSAP